MADETIPRAETLAAEATEPMEPPPPPAHPSPPPVYAPAPSAPTPSPYQRNPILAAVLSVMPGLGNVYNGLYTRGLAFFLIVVLLMRTAFTLDDENLALVIPSIIFFWLFNVFDAYRQATLINLAAATGTTPEPPQLRERLANGMLLPGVIIALIGLIGALDLYFRIDVWNLLRHWPVAAVAFGFWLAWSAVRARRQEERVGEI